MQIYNLYKFINTNIKSKYIDFFLILNIIFKYN